MYACVRVSVCARIYVPIQRACVCMSVFMCGEPISGLLLVGLGTWVHAWMTVCMDVYVAKSVLSVQIRALFLGRLYAGAYVMYA